MSGGRWEYMQYQLTELAGRIDEDINNKELWVLEELKEQESTFVIEALKEARDTLEFAHVLVQRLDWFISGDDGYESFTERLVDDLSKLRQRNEDRAKAKADQRASNDN